MDLDMNIYCSSNFQKNDGEYAIGSLAENEEPPDSDDNEWSDSYEVQSASDQDYSQESCESASAQQPPDLVMCLSFNLQYQEMMRNVITELEIALENNRTRQADLHEETAMSGTTFKAHTNKRNFFSKPHPYFQDKDNLACAANEDKRMKDENKDIDANLCHQRPCWKYHSRMELCTAVHKSAKKSRMEPIMEKKEYLCEKLTFNDITMEEKQIIREKLHNIDIELEKIRHLPITHLCSPDIRIDWMSIANTDMKGLRSAKSCELKWKNDLHPFINKTKWTEEEDSTLKSLVESHKIDDWDQIAEELETNRTALNCCERYQQHVNPVAQKGTWSEEEKQLLMDVVEMCRYGNYIPWVQVHYYMEARSLPTLKRFWNSTGNPVIIRGRWTPEEDFFLIAAVQKYGFLWTKIATLFGTRTGIQCRDRYRNSLSDKIYFRQWTGAEDRQLVDLVQELGPKWTLLAKGFSGRTDSMLCNRYKSIMKRYPNILEIMENETDEDREKPLVPSNSKARCKEKQQELRNHVEFRRQSLTKQLSQTQPTMRKTMRKFATKACKEKNLISTHMKNNLIFQEAKAVLMNSYHGLKKNDKKAEEKRKANREADTELGTMLSPILKRQPTAGRKVKALTGKSLIEYARTRSILYEALKVEEPREVGLTDVIDDVHDEKIGQTLEQHCLGPIEDQITPLPPVRTTIEGFKTLLVDLKRLAGSAVVQDLSSGTAMKVLTKRNGLPLVCSKCENLSPMAENSNLASSSQIDVSQETTTGTSRVEEVAHAVHAESLPFENELVQQECSECSRINRVDQNYTLLRSRFMALFFWPALMSTVAPPAPELTRKEEIVPTNTGQTNLKRKQPPSGGEPAAQKSKKDPPSQKKRTRKIKHAHYTEDGSVVAVRKSSRQLRSKETSCEDLVFPLPEFSVGGLNLPTTSQCTS